MRDRLIATVCGYGVAAFLAATGALAQDTRQIVVEPPAGGAQTAPAAPAAQAAQPAAACDQKNFISNKAIVDTIAADLDKQTTVRAKTTRYLTLTHMANLCVDPNLLNGFRQAVVKLLNSLSRSSDIVRFEPVDPAQTIVRFNIVDLGWSVADWETLISGYPYGALPDTALTAALERAAQTKLAYVRADWFAFAATRPPLYNKLLSLPTTLQALAKEQGVDIDSNIRSGIAQRAGFQKSGESLNNRMIERHPARGSYFWMTYDFAGNSGKQNLFDNPTGPGGTGGFTHDGSGVILGLPNGFQAYFQGNGKGEAVDRGPTQLVRDPNRPDLTVTTGISCIGCHDSGVRQIKDEIRDSALSGRQFPKATRDSVDALYAQQDKMDRMMADDGKRFTDAVTRAGLDPNLRLGGLEMINALSRWYESDVDALLVAAELGLTKDEFAQANTDAGDRPVRTFLRQLQQGASPRDRVEAIFATLVSGLTNDTAVKVAAPAAAKPGAAPQQAKPISGPQQPIAPARPRGQGGPYSNPYR